MTTEAAARLYLAQHLMEEAGKGYMTFNPLNKSVADLPVIYAFSNVKGGGEGIAYAIAEDGTCLGSHWCSCEAYVPHDLGVLEGARSDRHEHYRAHYSEGYRMNFILAAEVDKHPGLKEAHKKNQAAVRKEPHERE